MLCCCKKCKIADFCTVNFRGVSFVLNVISGASARYPCSDFTINLKLSEVKLVFVNGLYWTEYVFHEL